MAELTKTQLQAAEERAALHSLADDEVALQTSDTMPTRLKIRGTELESAGNPVHGATYTFTRKQVNQALERWGTEQAPRARRGRPARSGDRRTTRRGAQNAQAAPDATPQRAAQTRGGGGSASDAEAK